MIGHAFFIKSDVAWLSKEQLKIAYLDILE
jgi:hypothetical protein